jgi:hypothetical protein
MLSVFCSPSRYTQGSNAMQSLGQEMAALGMGGPALIVASRSAVASLSQICDLRDKARVLRTTLNTLAFANSVDERSLVSFFSEDSSCYMEGTAADLHCGFARGLSWSGI